MYGMYCIYYNVLCLRIPIVMMAYFHHYTVTASRPPYVQPSFSSLDPTSAPPLTITSEFSPSVLQLPLLVSKPRFLSLRLYTILSTFLITGTASLMLKAVRPESSSICSAVYSKLNVLQYPPSWMFFCGSNSPYRGFAVCGVCQCEHKHRIVEAVPTAGK